MTGNIDLQCFKLHCDYNGMVRWVALLLCTWPGSGYLIEVFCGCHQDPHAHAEITPQIRP
jgi:hypothetical protein